MYILDSIYFHITNSSYYLFFINIVLFNTTSDNSIHIGKNSSNSIIITTTLMCAKDKGQKFINTPANPVGRELISHESKSVWLLGIIIPCYYC